MADLKISGLSAQTTIATDDMFVLATAAGATKKITGGNLKSQVVAGAASIPIASLADPTTGKVIGSVSNAAAAVYPPGYRFDYVEKQSTTAVTGTTESNANAVVTANAVTYDGSTVIRITFECGDVEISVQALWIVLYDGASSIGTMGGTLSVAHPVHLTRVLTPSAASHTYSVRVYSASGAGNLKAGAGGNGNQMPAYIEQVKVA